MSIVTTALWRLLAVAFLVTAAGMPLPAQAAPAAGARAFASETGVASWYGEPFHGRKTANGETYDMLAMTAAHKTLPFGTLVLVTNLSNGSQVVVRINDRGPFIAGRIIDVSKAAAVMLGLDRSGTARVEIRPAPGGAEASAGAEASKGAKPGLKPVFPDSPTTRAAFSLQLGSYRDASNAKAQLERLSAMGLKAVIERSGSYHRVIVYVAADEKARVEASLRAAGCKDWLVRAL